MMEHDRIATEQSAGTLSNDNQAKLYFESPSSSANNVLEDYQSQFGQSRYHQL